MNSIRKEVWRVLITPSVDCLQIMRKEIARRDLDGIKVEKVKFFIFLSFYERELFEKETKQKS